MPKKRKLNSRNPIYKSDKENIEEYRRVLKKVGKNFKMYFLYEKK